MSVRPSPRFNTWIRVAGAAFALAGCGPQIIVGSAQQLTPEHDGWAEITTAAVAPAENQSCPGGRLFFASGSVIRATDLAGNFVSQIQLPVPETPTPHLIYDNHLVKMANGVLVHTFEGITWRDLDPKPPWWDLTETYPLKEESFPGGRANIWVFRSTDCGGNWQHVSDIDAALLEVDGTAGYCGHPRLKNENGVLSSDGGGWDAHLLNVGHYGTRLFLTTPCYFGEPTVGTNYADFLVLRSLDHGETWSVGCHLSSPGGWISRIPVTTFAFGAPTPSEWIAYARLSGDMLRLTRFPLNGTCDYAVASELEITPSAPDMRDDATIQAATVFTGLWGYSSIARTGDIAQVSTFDWIDGGTRLAFKIALLQAEPNPPYPPAILVTTLSGQNPGSDLLHASFVEAPNGTMADLFYYLERIPGDPNSFQVGFRVRGEGATMKTGLLTVDNGQSYTWPYENYFVGDYMTGASYQTETTVVFVLPWSQNGGLYFNTVTVPLGSLDPNLEYLDDAIDVVQPIAPMPPVGAHRDGRADSISRNGGVDLNRN